jgi:hypothetical protein
MVRPMSRAIGDLINTLTMLVPLRVLIVVAVLLAVSAAPLWMESVRDRQLRGLVRRCVRAEHTQRDTLVAEVLRIAADRPSRLRTVVHAATQYDQRDLHHRALAALEATGKAAEDVKRLRQRIEKPPITFRDPLEAVVRVEALLGAGLRVGAQEHLAAALRAFPRDPDLEGLRARAEAPEESPPSPAASS